MLHQCKNDKTAKSKCLKKADSRCFEYAVESILNPVIVILIDSNYKIIKYETLSIEYPTELISEYIEKIS